MRVAVSVGGPWVGVKVGSWSGTGVPWRGGSAAWGALVVLAPASENSSERRPGAHQHSGSH